MTTQSIKAISDAVIDEVSDAQISNPKDKSDIMIRGTVVAAETGLFGATSLGVVLGRIHPLIPVAVAGGSALLNSKMFKETPNDESEKEN